MNHESCLKQQPTILVQVKTFREQILRAKDSSKVGRVAMHLPCGGCLVIFLFVAGSHCTRRQQV